VVLISLLSAFGIFSRALEEDRDEYQLLRTRAQGIDLADSITVDGHKMLNVVCKLILSLFQETKSFISLTILSLMTAACSSPAPRLSFNPSLSTQTPHISLQAQ
jgi:hypothetical protein